MQHQVAEEMSTYGYVIVKTLITKVEPDAEVKQSMNEINAAQRKRVAAQELANADKIKIVHHLLSSLSVCNLKHWHLSS